jgi:hypothetical protein
MHPKILVLLAMLALSACAVVDAAGSVASTAVSVTGTVVETAVDTVTYPVRK